METPQFLTTSQVSRILQIDVSDIVRMKARGSLVPVVQGERGAPGGIPKPNLYDAGMITLAALLKSWGVGRTAALKIAAKARIEDGNIVIPIEDA